jgi:hypothetical protein
MHSKNISRHAEKLRDVIDATISSVLVAARETRALRLRLVVRPVVMFDNAARDIVPARDIVARFAPLLRVVMRDDGVVGVLRD